MKKIIPILTGIVLLVMTPSSSKLTSLEKKIKKNTTTQYENCLKELSNHKPKKDYREGEIIVLFDNEITPGKANDLIEIYDLTNELKTIEIRRFQGEPLQHTKVKLPKGKEKQYVCYFKSLGYGTPLRGASLNTTFYTD